MTRVLEHIHPAGWTGRRVYRLAVLACAALLLIAAASIFMAGLPVWALGAAAMVAIIFLLPLTIRRLRDAGLSVWWVLLVFFPFGISVDLATVETAGWTFHFIDFSELIRSIPVLLGLIMPSQPTERRVL